MSSQIVFTMRSTVVLPVVLASLVFLLFHRSHGAYLSEFGTYSPCLAPCTDYGIVITPRLKPRHSVLISVYKFKLHKRKQLEPSDVEKMRTDPSEVPIDYDKVFQDTSSIASYVLPLVNAAKHAIPSNHHLSTPIFFSYNEKLNSLNPGAWFRLVGELNLFFLNKTVPFLAGPFSVEETKADREAMFKWQTINFLNGYLSNTSKTVGVLSFNTRMGSEISFENFVVDGSVTSLFSVGGVSRAVVTSNFFKRGDTYPLNKYFSVISSTRKEGAVIRSPCGPKGVKKRFKGLPGVKWIVGTGNIKKCRSIIRRYLLSVCDKINGCASLNQPFQGTIIGYPDVGETMKRMGYHDCEEHLSPAKLDANIRRVCGGSKNPAKKRTHTKASREGQITKHGEPKPQAIIDCINGNFLYLMLTEQYKLKDDTSIQIERNIAGIPIDRSLGELLTKVGLLA